MARPSGSQQLPLTEVERLTAQQLLEWSRTLEVHHLSLREWLVQRQRAGLSYLPLALMRWAA